jgi:hypothetical protein
MPDLELLGRAAYMAYCQCFDGRSAITGEPLPTWEDQRPDIREAWRAAADAVLMLGMPRSA